jgi:hypothetical protein
VTPTRRYELQEQVKKHQSRLRKDYEWKRKRPRAAAEALSWVGRESRKQTQRDEMEVAAAD